MERAAAIKKLGKLLGKSFGYRVDPTAPDKDARAEAREILRVTGPQREAIGKAVTARREALLKADAEYQRLLEDYRTATLHCDRLSATLHHYRFTAGNSNGMFFHVKAQGDSWEDVIEQLTEKRPAVGV